VGTFSNSAAIIRLVGAMLLERNDEYSLNRRYIQLEELRNTSDTNPIRGHVSQRSVPCISVSPA
jgi:putative transposase